MRQAGRRRSLQTQTVCAHSGSCESLFHQSPHGCQRIIELAGVIAAGLGEIRSAATAATEHFTAVFAGWMLRHPEALEGAEPRLQTLWLWHSAEESEHRCTAFDIHHAAGGSQAWRVRTFYYVTVIFLSDVLRQTVRNLWHDGSLFQWRTWRSAARLLMAPDGLLRGSVGLWRDYLKPDFHPSQHPPSHAQAWLRDNADQFAVVRAAR